MRQLAQAGDGWRESRADTEWESWLLPDGFPCTLLGCPFPLENWKLVFQCSVISLQKNLCSWSWTCRSQYILCSSPCDPFSWPSHLKMKHKGLKECITAYGSFSFPSGFESLSLSSFKIPYPQSLAVPPLSLWRAQLSCFVPAFLQLPPCCLTICKCIHRRCRAVGASPACSLSLQALGSISSNCLDCSLIPSQITFFWLFWFCSCIYLS